jgi:positive regulator of sigma E activity
MMESKERAVLSHTLLLYIVPTFALASGSFFSGTITPPTTTLCVVVLLGRELGAGVVGHLGPKLQLLLIASVGARENQ